jgi:two-component system cell cycle response regulator
VGWGYESASACRYFAETSSGKSMNPEQARLSDLLDDLEYHRAFDVASRLERAIRAEQEAIAAGALDIQMRARLVQADMLQRMGRVTAGARLATEVNWWARQQGPQTLLARSHLVLSSILESVGDSASCLDHALRAVELLDGLTPLRTRGNFLVRLADAYAVAGSFDAARDRYAEADRLFMAIGDVERRLNALNNLAYAEYEAGDAGRAGAAAEAVRSLAESSGLVLNPTFLDTLARVHMLLGQYAQAEQVLEAALAAYDSGGDVQAVTPAELMLTLAEVQRRQGRLEQAQRTLDECRAICVERHLTGVEVEVLREQAELHAAAGRLDQAFETYKIFHAEVESLSSNRREAAARTRQAMFETAEAHEDARQFRRQARTDALTGLPNRRYVTEELAIRLSDVTPAAPLVVAVFGADRFKVINDALSHGVGDQVIRELGQLLSATLAEGDKAQDDPPSFVARLGGEEFLAVLSGLDLAAAARVLEKMRAAVEAHPWRPLIGDLPLTVSVGAVTGTARDEPSDLLARTDRTLYEAKKAGRNRVAADFR